MLELNFHEQTIATSWKHRGYELQESGWASFIRFHTFNIVFECYRLQLIDMATYVMAEVINRRNDLQFGLSLCSKKWTLNTGNIIL